MAGGGEEVARQATRQTQEKKEVTRRPWRKMVSVWPQEKKEATRRPQQKMALGRLQEEKKETWWRR
jgi:hypothetical protein